MEFIFKDAKQYTALEQCQARREKILYFHFNVSMTSISVGKGIIRKDHSKEKTLSLSISNVKTELQNRNMVYRIFSIYGFIPKLIKIHTIYSKLLSIGKIAA